LSPVLLARSAHLDPSEGKALHEALRDVNPVEAEEFNKNVLSPAEIERRKHHKATPTPSRSEVPMSDANLRASLIRLAHANPSLRAAILPLVAPSLVKKDGAKAAGRTAATVTSSKFMDILDFMMNAMDDIMGKSEKVSALAQITGNRGLAKALADARQGLRGADVGRWSRVSAGDEPQREMLTKWIEEAGHTVAGPKTAGPKTAGPDAMGRGWKQKDNGGKHRWVWAGQSGDPAFTVTEQSTPVGLIYKLQILMPDGDIFQTFGQKTEKEHWFKRAAQLYKAWGSAAGFDLSNQPEKWSRL